MQLERRRRRQPRPSPPAPHGAGGWGMGWAVLRPQPNKKHSNHLNLLLPSPRKNLMSSKTRITQPRNTPFKDAYSTPERHQTFFTLPSQTKQSFKDECDVNRIVARFQATGQIPNINELPPQYLDVTALDFQEHQNFIAEAQSMFMEMPSALRSRFNNSPGEFLDFCSQEKNRAEMTQLGLLRPLQEAIVPSPIPIPQPNLSTAQNPQNPSQPNLQS